MGIWWHEHIRLVRKRSHEIMGSTFGQMAEWLWRVTQAISFSALQSAFSWALPAWVRLPLCSPHLLALTIFSRNILTPHDVSQDCFTFVCQYGVKACFCCVGIALAMLFGGDIAMSLLVLVSSSQTSLVGDEMEHCANSLTSFCLTAKILLLYCLMVAISVPPWRIVVY
jgi:hypothetical protein